MEEDICVEDDSKSTDKFMSKSQIKETVNFIAKFDNSKEQSKQLENYKNLLLFFKKNKIKIGLVDADILFSKCKNLTTLFDCIDGIIGYVQDDNIDSLLSAYESNKVALEENLTSEGLFENRFNKNDLDLISLYFNELKNYNVLTPEEERELAIKVASGDEQAKEILVCHNLKLVASVAKKYVNHGLTYSDLIQEGNLGLLKAVDKFDVNKGYKFSTYAMWWIKQSMLRAIADKGKTIRVPVHLREVILKMKREITKYESENFGEMPTLQHLSKVVGKPVNTILLAQKYSNELLSLSTPVGDVDEDESELGYFIEDENTDIDDTISKLYNDDVRNTLFNSGVISEREIKILKYRYGFYDGHIYTLEEIGAIFNVTRERIRQIEVGAIRRLSHDKKMVSFAQAEEYKYAYEYAILASKKIKYRKRKEKLQTPQTKLPVPVEEAPKKFFYEEYPMTLSKRSEALSYYSVK